MDEMLAMIDRAIHDEECKYRERIGYLREERDRIIALLVERKSLEPMPPMLVTGGLVGMREQERTK